MANELWKSITKPEAITGILIIIGGVTLVLQRLGLLVFGKKKAKCNPDCLELIKKIDAKSDSCPVPDCHDKVLLTASKVETLEKGQDIIFGKIDTTNDSIIKLGGLIARIDSGMSETWKSELKKMEDRIISKVQGKKGLRR